MSSQVIIRPMHSDDLPVAEQLCDEAFYELERETFPPSWPPPKRRSQAHSAAWLVRSAHYLAGDPGGCWVSEREGEMLGFAISHRRDLTWILATYAVRHGVQGNGIGKALLDAALTHSRGCLRGMFAASADPRAVRRYKLAGFDLYPQMVLQGIVDKTELPEIEHVRDGTAGDFALLDSLDRRTRDAAHGDDHRVLLGLFRLLVTDSTSGAGYAYCNESGEVVLLAATNRRTATRLLWSALAQAPTDRPVTIAHIDASNQWALDVGIAARLSVHTWGYLALRGMRPPSPYIPHGSFL